MYDLFITKGELAYLNVNRWVNNVIRKCYNESITHGNFGILINKCNDVLNYFDDNLQIITTMARMLNAVQDVPQRIHYFD